MTDKSEQQFGLWPSLCGEGMVGVGKTANDAIRQLDAKLAALAVVKETVSKRGLRKGNGGYGSMACPVKECMGTVTYVVSGHNGHIKCACDKAHCINWME